MSLTCERSLNTIVLTRSKLSGSETHEDNNAQAQVTVLDEFVEDSNKIRECGEAKATSFAK